MCVPVLMLKLVLDEERADRSSVDESVASEVYTVRGDFEPREESFSYVYASLLE